MENNKAACMEGKRGEFFFFPSVTQRFISANPSYISVGKLEQ